MKIKMENPVSHFEMYIDSIEAFGLNSTNIFKNLNTLKGFKDN